MDMNTLDLSTIQPSQELLDNFQSAMTKLAEDAAVQPTTSGYVVTIDGVPLTCLLEPLTQHIKVVADLGAPPAEEAASVHRYLLAQQSTMVVPSAVMAALNPEDDHILLIGGAPVPAPANSDEQESLKGFLFGMSLIVNTWAESPAAEQKAPEDL